MCVLVLWCVCRGCGVGIVQCVGVVRAVVAHEHVVCGVCGVPRGACRVDLCVVCMPCVVCGGGVRCVWCVWCVERAVRVVFVGRAACVLCDVCV